MKINKFKIRMCILIILIFLSYLVVIDVHAYTEHSIESMDTSNLEVLSSDKKEDEYINLDDEIGNCTNVKYIENGDYFKGNPQHYNNNGENSVFGECTTVAMQLLMGYHNYYSDGRLIPEFKDDETRFLNINYRQIESHPIINKARSSGTGNPTTGTEDEVFEEIKELTDFTDVPVVDQMIGLVREGAERFVDKYASDISSNVYIDDGLFSETEAKSDIDNNLPIILGFNPVFSEAVSFHVMVAYGYATLNGVDGFIVHCGWGSEKTHMWVPSSWFGYQIRMSVDHKHTYVDSEVNVNNQYRKLTCSTCGCTAVDKLYDIDEDSFTLVNLKYNLSGEINIPNIMYGVEIKNIGNSVFENQSNITSVFIPNSIETIGNRAFANCENIKKINLPEGLTSIGAFTFYGCSSITSLTIDSNVTYIGESAFENCTSLYDLLFFAQVENIRNNTFKNCESLISIYLQDTITNIGESSFENCTSLKNVTLSENLNIIGVYAFKNCKSIESISIPENVIYILNSAFENCENLKSVYIEKAKGDVISISSNVFDGCTLLEDIYVPTNKYLEYLNNPLWKEYEYYVIYDERYEEIFIDCKTDMTFEKTLENKDSEVYRVKVDCAKSYTISVTGSDEVFIKLYNQSLSLMDIDLIMSNENFTGSVVVYLSKGMYYLSVGYVDSNSIGELSTNIKATWPSSKQQIFYSYDIYRNNILDHLHNVTDTLSETEVYYINNSSDFYRFTLTGVTDSGVNIVYPSSVITIKDNSNENIIDKFSYEGYDNQAKSSSIYNPNSLVAYLEYDGYYYIHISVPEDNLVALYLDIELVDYQEMNVFDRIEDFMVKPLDSVNLSGDYIKKLEFEQTAKYRFSVSYSGEQAQDVLFIFIKKNDDDTFSSVYSFLMNSENNNYYTEIIIEEGMYYIGYFNKEQSGYVNVAFGLISNYSTGDEIIADPEGMLCGSQINIIEKEYLDNQKSYGGVEITKGFTRIVYLDSNLTDTNRSNYSWYSSDESIASISAFGTLFGKKEGVVKIMAIYKNDPSIIYYKEFTIIDNIETSSDKYYIHIYDTFNLANEIYKLPLNSSNCPYPMIQYYNWSIEVTHQSDENFSVSLDEWGNLTATSTGSVDIIGEYSLNDKYVIIIHLDIVV